MLALSPITEAPNKNKTPVLFMAEARPYITEPYNPASIDNLSHRTKTPGDHINYSLRREKEQPGRLLSARVTRKTHFGLSESYHKFDNLPGIAAA